VTTPGAMKTAFHAAMNALAASRPTAVNLFASLSRVRRVVERNWTAGMGPVRDFALREAMVIRQEDIDACTAIGTYGAALLAPGSTVLTHCNAGALATAGIGTALGVITVAAAQGRVLRVYVDETRPLLQGARLTTWELGKAGIDHVLITDSTAGSVFRSARIDAVLVGADRIAANGDTANKVGTYPVAVLARYHRVPFYVAAPLSTIDRATPTGDDIPIEERDAREVTEWAGVPLAPAGVHVYAPAFDVTPCELIAAIVTEAGVLRPPFDRAIAGLPAARTGEEEALP
jgi:methylthioribose-1-phosphate isomerase